MALSVKVGSFNTGTGTSDIVVSGLGFQPKFVIFHWNGRTESTDTVGAKSLFSGWGFAVSTTDRRAVSQTATLGASAGAGATVHSDAACVITTTDAGSADGTFDLKSMDSDGFTLSVSDANSIDLRVMYIAIGGTDITNVKGGMDTSNSATGNKSVTGVGFQPDILFFIASMRSVSTPPDYQSSHSGMSFGVAMSSSKQYTWAGGMDDGSASMDTGAYIYSGEFLASTGSSTPTTISDRKSLVSMDTDGFTFNQLDLGQTGTPYFHYLAIKGGNWDVGDFLTSTTSPASITESGLSFQPTLAMFTSANRAQSTQDAGTTPNRLSFGAATGTGTSQIAMAHLDEHGTANGEPASAVDYDEIYLNVSTSDTIDGSAEFSSFNSDGFSLGMTNGDPAQSFVWWVAVGPSETSTPKTVTDSGTGADAISSISMTGTVTDTGSGTDTPSIEASLTVTDSGAGIDTVDVTSPVSSTDTGAGTDQVSVSASLTVADTGSGGAETVDIAATVPVADVGSGSDAVSISVTLSVGDVGSGADSASAASGGSEISVADVGSGSEIVTVTADLSLADTGSGADTMGSITASVPVADMGAGNDTIGGITAALTVTDTGSGLETPTITVTLTIIDAGSGADAPTVSADIEKTVLESGSGAEVLDIQTSLSVSDTGVGTDQVSVTVTLTVADDGAAADLISEILATLAVSDIAAGADIATGVNATTRIVSIVVTLAKRNLDFMLKTRIIEFGFSVRSVEATLAQRTLEFTGQSTREISFSLAT